MTKPCVGSSSTGSEIAGTFPATESLMEYAQPCIGTWKKAVILSGLIVIPFVPQSTPTISRSISQALASCGTLSQYNTLFTVSTLVHVYPPNTKCMQMSVSSHRSTRLWERHRWQLISNPKSPFDFLRKIVISSHGSSPGCRTRTSLNTVVTTA